jgi:hypothetical protein
MSKYERQTYRMIMGAIAIIGIILCIDAPITETEWCPKGGQFGAGLSILVLAYIGWPITPDSHE